MTLETLNIAHITKYIKDLPFQIDKSRLDAIKNSLENDIPIELEERFYYDTIANDIMKIANKKEGTTTAAFLIMQLPFVHTEMVSNYIEAVYRDENPVGAYFAIQLNSAVKSIEDNDRLLSIIIDNGDVPLWIESIRNIPDIPIDVIIKKVSQSNSESIALWNREIGIQAKLMYEDLCESLKKPIEKNDHIEADQDFEDEELSKIAKIKETFGSPIKSIKNRKKQ